MIKEELVYDLNVFDLNKQDDKWKKFWKHFVASCSPKASVTPNLCQREFMRVKYGSPQIIKDNWKELIKKTNPFSRWLRSRGAEWSVSDGKLSRSSNANPDLYHATMTLSEILGEDLIGQRRGKKAWQPSCAPSCGAASLSPSSLMSSHSLLRCVPLNCSQAISITPMGYREWHTNRFDPWGWRLYIVHTDPSGCGMFRFQEPQSHHKLQSGMGHIEGQQEQGSKPSPSPRQIHTRIDHDGSIRLFRVRGGQDALWHSICSEGGDRWSLGFAISDKAAQALLSMR